MQFQDNQQLINIVDSAPIGICILDAKTFVVEMLNDKFLEISGKPEEAIVGKWYWEPFAEAREYYESALSNVPVTGESYYADEVQLMLIRHGQKEFIFVTFVYSPVKNEAGEVTKVAVWVLENTTQVRERQKVAAAKKIAETERNHLYKFFSQAPVGICVLAGPNLVYELVNPKYQELLPGRELLNRPIFEALPELVGTPLQQVLLNVYQKGVNTQIDELLIPVSEYEGGPTENRYFSFNYQGRRDENEQIDGIFAFVLEVTDQVTIRKKTEESEKHFRYLADLVPAKISNAMPSGEVTFFNRQWLDYSGMNFEDLRDFGYLQMMHPDEIPTFQAQLAEAAAKGVALESEMRFKDLDGNYRWHLNIASPVLNEKGEITMWVGSTIDIQRIKEEEQRKSDFIGMVSHEMKTPLTSLNAYLQVLRLKLAETGDQFVQRSVEQSVKQVKKMTAMINGFLNVSRLESGQIPIIKTLFNIQELFAEIEAETSPMNTTHTIIFSCEFPVMINGDREKIGQVLNNFISNAVKYSKSGTEIYVSCAVDETNIIIFVNDQGIGIKPDDLKYVFDRYFRAETQSHISGFGIGLYLCAEIIRRHNGKVWAESENEKGSTFYFSLPLDLPYLT